VFTEPYSYCGMIQQTEVNPSDRLKHHYRECNKVTVASYGNALSIPTVCRRRLNKSVEIDDDVMLTYAEHLTVRSLCLI
jgi:hypothetical protein